MPPGGFVCWPSVWLRLLGFDLFIANPPILLLNAVLMFPLGWTFVTRLLEAGTKNWAEASAAGSEKKFSFPLATASSSRSGLGGLASALWLIPNESVRFLPFHSGILPGFLSGGSLQADGLWSRLHVFHGCINFAQATIVGSAKMAEGISLPGC